jgi:hypothetical protein
MDQRCHGLGNTSPCKGEVDRRERSDRWSGGGLSMREIAAVDPTRLALLADLP